MRCPICGNIISPNKGWAGQFYDGYCNHCDMPIENGVPDGETEGEDSVGGEE